MIQSILNNVLGNLTIDFIVSFYIFALIGVILSMLFHYGKKTRKKTGKPFSFTFWIKDNIVRLFISIICIFVVLRLPEFVGIPMENVNMGFGFIVGISLDRIIIVIRNKTKTKLI